MVEQVGWSGVLRQLSQARVLVVGDVMLDRYIWGRATRLSPEAPVPIVQVELGRRGEGLRLGGAANVANNIRHLGGSVALFGVLGDDDTARQARQVLASLHIGQAGVLTDPTRPSTLKTRVIAQHQQVVRFDIESTAPISAATEQALFEAVLAQSSPRETLETPHSSPAEAVTDNASVGPETAGLSSPASSSTAPNPPWIGAVILSDYAKGVLTEGLVQPLVKALRARQIPVLVDPKVKGIERFRGASLITPNREEACAAAGVHPSEPLAHVKAAERLLDRLELDAVLVTLGEEGLYYHPREGQPLQWQSQAREVFDVTGAGDTVVAVLGMGLAARLPSSEALLLANLAAGVVVGKLGTAVVGLDELEEALQKSARPR